MRPKATTPASDLRSSLSVVELAWAAGFFEGEGSVRINSSTRRNATHLLVDLPNTDESMVLFFVQRWGGTVTAKPDKGRQRRHWRWRASSRMAARFFADILPYVRSDRVRTRVTLALEFQAQKSGPGRRPSTDRPNYFAEQQVYYQRMKALNLRGVQHGADAVS